jgi:hypothetical protein
MKKEFKVLVCGGREFGWAENANRQRVMNQEEVKHLSDTLDQIKVSIETLEMTMVVIQGEAKGADSWGKKWAIVNDVPTLDFTPDWDTYGKKAGFIRNSAMLKEGNPDLVVAFRGGKGTDMMREISEKANVAVKKTF